MDERPKKAPGVSVSEIGFVLILMGILAVIVIPKIIDLASTATETSIAAMEANVKSTFAITLAENVGVYPNLEMLAEKTRNGTINKEGIVFTINGERYIVRTYTDQSCKTATEVPKDKVRCIGSIEPLLS